MKRLTVATCVSMPGALWAHGAHVPVPAETHVLAHAAPWLALVPIGIAVLLWARGRAS